MRENSWAKNLSCHALILLVMGALSISAYGHGIGVAGELMTDWRTDQIEKVFAGSDHTQPGLVASMEGQYSGEDHLHYGRNSKAEDDNLLFHTGGRYPCGEYSADGKCRYHALSAT